VDPIVTAIIAVILVAIAWKVFKGVVKTLVLLAILLVAALVVFGGMI
jgi:hypothetical protein